MECTGFSHDSRASVRGLESNSRFDILFRVLDFFGFTRNRLFARTACSFNVLYTVSIHARKVRDVVRRRYVRITQSRECANERLTREKRYHMCATKKRPRAIVSPCSHKVRAGGLLTLSSDTEINSRHVIATFALMSNTFIRIYRTYTLRRKATENKTLTKPAS